jgi:hypothetical protein
MFIDHSKGQAQASLIPSCIRDGKKENGRESGRFQSGQ